MATFLLLPHFHYSHSLLISRNETNSQFFKRRTLTREVKPHYYYSLNPPKASAADDNGSNNGAIESPKPSRRGRKKKATSASSATKASAKKKAGRSEKTQVENGSTDAKETNRTEESIEDFQDYGDDMDFPYDDPPLVCCFGAVQKEFVPTVRVHDNQMHPDIYSTWKMLQWDPPEFVRAPGGPPSNVAISHMRLGGRAAFMGKVGADDYGDDLVLMMNKEKVQTRAVKFDKNVKTGCTSVKIKFEDGKMRAETVKAAAEDSLRSSELNLAVLKEVKFIELYAEV